MTKPGIFLHWQLQLQFNWDQQLLTGGNLAIKAPGRGHHIMAHYDRRKKAAGKSQGRGRKLVGKRIINTGN